MKPDAPIVLGAALGSLGRLAGSEPDPMKKMILGSVQGILGVILRDWDDLAASRVREIEELSALLLRGAGLAPEELSGRLSAAATRPEDARSELRLSSLDGVVSRLRSAVIELQAWLETAATPEAEELLGDTWSVIGRGVRSRAIPAFPWF